VRSGFEYKLVHTGGRSLPKEHFYYWNVLARFAHAELIAPIMPRLARLDYRRDDPVASLARHKRASREVITFVRPWGTDDKTVDDFFGSHRVYGIGTFCFLQRLRRLERKAGRDYACRDYNSCREAVAPGFHRYLQSPEKSVACVTHALDSNHSSVIRSAGYVFDTYPVLIEMAFKIARTGNPRHVGVRSGSYRGSEDLKEARIYSRDGYPVYNSWYETTRKAPVQTDPKKTYILEIEGQSGCASKDPCTVFGEMSLRKDFVFNFGCRFEQLRKRMNSF
jgi:hypothetical protein